MSLPYRLRSLAFVVSLVVGVPFVCQATELEKREKAEIRELAADLDKRAKSAFKGKWVGKILDHSKLAGQVVFSPDGQWALYFAHQDEKVCAVVVNAAGSLKDEWFDSAGGASFSANGLAAGYIGYRTLTGKKHGLVSVRQELGKPFDDIKAPHFEQEEPGSEEITTQANPSAEKPKQSFLVLGVRQSLHSDQIIWKIITPAGEEWAYKLDKGRQGPEKEFVSLDKQLLATGKDSADMNKVLLTGTPALSPDGTQVAFEAKAKDGVFVVSGSLSATAFQRGETYESISDLTFSPNGQVVYTGFRKNRYVVVMGGLLSDTFESINTPWVFSSTGSAVSFGARSGQDLSWESLGASESKNK